MRPPHCLLQGFLPGSLSVRHLLLSALCLPRRLRQRKAVSGSAAERKAWAEPWASLCLYNMSCRSCFTALHPGALTYATGCHSHPRPGAGRVRPDQRPAAPMHSSPIPQASNTRATGQKRWYPALKSLHRLTVLLMKTSCHLFQQEKNVCWVDGVRHEQVWSWRWQRAADSHCCSLDSIICFGIQMMCFLHRMKTLHVISWPEIKHHETRVWKWKMLQAEVGLAEVWVQLLPLKGMRRCLCPWSRPRRRGQHRPQDSSVGLGGGEDAGLSSHWGWSEAPVAGVGPRDGQWVGGWQSDLTRGRLTGTQTVVPGPQQLRGAGEENWSSLLGTEGRRWASRRSQK